MATPKRLDPKDRVRLLELAVESGAPLYEAIGVAQEFEKYVLGQSVTKNKFTDAVEDQTVPTDRVN